MKVIFISRIIDVLFPMYANYKTNKSLRQKLEANDVGILSYMDNAEDISTESLKQEYQETLRIKDKLEDKAKTNVVGITITITLIMGASNVLSAITKKYPMPIFQWIGFVLFVSAVSYMITAGILAIKVLIDENRIYVVDIGTTVRADANVRVEYDRCITKNRTTNLIRNNTVFTSYECIRNSLVCLFVILLLSAAPITSGQDQSSIEIHMSSTIEPYNITYSSSAVTYLSNNDIKGDVEEFVICAWDNLSKEQAPGTVGVVDSKNCLFLKFSADEENNITILSIEPYIDY